MTDWRMENCVTITAAAGTVIALYAMGAGGHAFWGLLFLLNINYIKTK